NLPIDVACGAPRALVTRSPRAYAVESRHMVSLHVLAVCEGMSGVPSILIVGADESFRRTLAASLRAKGFEYETARGADDGKRKREIGAHEVVVVNLDVPGGID